MSLEKAINHKKEYRKEYKDSRAFDRSCRNHGSCNYCKNNRTYQYKKALSIAKDEEKEYNNAAS